MIGQHETMATVIATIIRVQASACGDSIMKTNKSGCAYIIDLAKKVKTIQILRKKLY